MKSTRDDWLFQMLQDVWYRTHCNTDQCHTKLIRGLSVHFTWKIPMNVRKTIYATENRTGLLHNRLVLLFLPEIIIHYITSHNCWIVYEIEKINCALGYVVLWYVNTHGCTATSQFATRLRSLTNLFQRDCTYGWCGDSVFPQIGCPTRASHTSNYFIAGHMSKGQSCPSPIKDCPTSQQISGAINKFCNAMGGILAWSLWRDKHNLWGIAILFLSYSRFRTCSVCTCHSTVYHTNWAFSYTSTGSLL